MDEIATQAGHFYDAKTGEPRYTIIGANGKERPTTLRDARKRGWVPSVTTVMAMANKVGLNIWMQRQVLLAALTLPRRPNESEEDFCDRIIADSKEQAKAAAERGTKLHTAIERAIAGNADPEYDRHITAVKDALGSVGVDLYGGTSERSFASKLGYGGKVDLSSNVAIVDFKSKDKIEDGKEYAYDEHATQLSAYRHGLGYGESTRLLSVFVGVNDAKVVVREWTNAEAARGLEMFKALLAFWKAQSGMV